MQQRVHFCIYIHINMYYICGGAGDRSFHVNPRRAPTGCSGPQAHDAAGLFMVFPPHTLSFDSLRLSLPALPSNLRTLFEPSSLSRRCPAHHPLSPGLTRSEYERDTPLLDGLLTGSPALASLRGVAVRDLSPSEIQHNLLSPVPQYTTREGRMSSENELFRP